MSATRAVRVDLTGSRLGPGWRSVVNLGDWPESWDDERLRSEAAAHYEVPVEQVRIVPEDYAEADDGGGMREAVSLALAELTGLDAAALDTYEQECLNAAVRVLVGAAKGGGR